MTYCCFCFTILLCQAKPPSTFKISQTGGSGGGTSAIKIWRPTWWLNLCSPTPLKLHKPAKAASVARKMRSAVVSLFSLLSVSHLILIRDHMIYLLLIYLTGVLGHTSCRGNCCPHYRHNHSLRRDGNWRKRPKQINAGRCLPLPVSSCLEWARDFFWPEVRLGQVEQGEAGEVQRRSVRFKLIVLYTMVHCCPPYIAFWNHTLQPTMQWNTLHNTMGPHIKIHMSENTYVRRIPFFSLPIFQRIPRCFLVWFFSFLIEFKSFYCNRKVNHGQMLTV